MSISGKCRCILASACGEVVTVYVYMNGCFEYSVSKMTRELVVISNSARSNSLFIHHCYLQTCSMYIIHVLCTVQPTCT